LRNRLVVEWSKDTVNWAKTVLTAAAMPVVEIADPQVVTFPVFDCVLISHDELQSVIEDFRYVPWRTALATVKGIHLIADTSTSKLYIGMADEASACGAYGRPTPATATGQRRAARAGGG